MKSGIVLALLLCAPVAAQAAVETCGPANFADSVAHMSTPAIGSAERKAMLDVVRTFVRRMSDLDVVFAVGHIKSGCGWGWIEADPRSADGTQHYEQVQVLLARRNGHWKYIESPPEWSECEIDPDCIDRTRYFRKLAKKHPRLPPAIFPVVAPGE